ncbi:hypothetical protein [Leadbetterella sp. DM7]|uniref:hypothetical protein n=1 Tax=Leadbetterella sp. DM7 TaxID=3235085 RepID=UPI00349EABED
MKFLKSFLPVFLVFTLSCNNRSSAEMDQLYEELVKGHDEVMPKSMAIPSIRENMIKAVENAPEDKKNTALDISTRLQKAEEQMNEWMVEFGNAINTEAEDQKLETYKRLHEEIIRLKAETDSSISEAKKLTAEFQ